VGGRSAAGRQLRSAHAAQSQYVDLITILPRPETTQAREHPTLPAAELAEVVQLYGLRQWVEQGYKQELGWADIQVRADRAIRRHEALVCCAFRFCWWAEDRQDDAAQPPIAAALPLHQEPGAGEKWDATTTGSPPAAWDVASRARQLRAAAVLAARPAAGAGLA
jgi:hypothetical protein